VESHIEKQGYKAGGTNTHKIQEKGLKGYLMMYLGYDHILLGSSYWTRCGLMVPPSLHLIRLITDQGPNPTDSACDYAIVVGFYIAV